MNKFDKPYRILPNIDIGKGSQLFTLASKLDTHELLQFSLINQIPLNYENEDGECLIHHVVDIDPRKASEHSKLNVIKFLVQNGVNPDKPNKYNQTPLHLACSQQYPIIVKYLLEIGVNPNYQDNMGLSPFHYLLTGKIKTIEPTDVMDFIPPPKNKVVDKSQNILEIKKKLWELIKYTSDYENLPLLKTLENTINGIIEEDPIVVNRRLESFKIIQRLASNESSPNKFAEIKETINVSRKTLTDKILKLFNNLPEINNFEIHSKELTSWSPLSHGKESLIKNGNVKRTLKNEMQQAADNIKKLNDHLDIPQVEIAPIGDFFNGFIRSIPEINRQIIDAPDGSDFSFYNGTFDDNTLGLYNQANDRFRHALALDNASDIIDFDNLKYVAGPRRMAIAYYGPSSTECNIFNDLAQNQIINTCSTNVVTVLGRILAYDKEDKIILDLLSSPIDITLLAVNSNLLDDLLDDLNDLDRNRQLNFEDPTRWYYYKPSNIQTTIEKDKAKEIETLLGQIVAAYGQRAAAPRTMRQLSQPELNIFYAIIFTFPSVLQEQEISAIINYIRTYYTLPGALAPGALAPRAFAQLPLFQVGPLKPDDQEIVIAFITSRRSPIGPAAAPPVAPFALGAPAANLFALGVPADAQAAPAGPVVPLDHINDMKAYLVLAFTAIQYPERFNEISKNPKILNYGLFAHKWINIYNKGVYLCSWIYGMWCDVMCKFSNSNLDGVIPVQLLLLLAGLKCYTADKSKGIINAFKSHLINNIFNANVNLKVAIIKWVLTLLNENFDNNFLKNYINFTHTDNTFINGIPNVDEDLKNLLMLIYNYVSYLENLPVPDTGFNPPDQIYYNKYSIGKDKPSDVICKIILDLYEKMANKPLKQTVLDTLYCIKQIEQKTGGDVLNLFKSISTTYLYDLSKISNYNQLGFKINHLPSLYSYLNFISQTDILDKLKLAHILGLYYEGSLLPHRFDLLHKVVLKNRRINPFTFRNNQNLPAAHIITNGTIYLDKQLPLPLNYLIMFNQYESIYIKYQEQHPRKINLDAKYHYYDIEGRPLILPAADEHANLLWAKVTKYRNEIKKSLDNIDRIIAELLGGKTTKLKEVFVDHYPSLITLCKLLDGTIESLEQLDILNKSKDIESNNLDPIIRACKKYNYTELAKSLNKINSTFYLYFYLFSRDKLIRLSRFNYYQLPLENPSEFFYYNSDIENEFMYIINETYPPNVSGAVNHPESTNHESSIKGIINQFSFSNYHSFLNEYKLRQFPTNFIFNNAMFLRLKTTKLPPSLQNALSDFYKYTVIELVKKILKYINDPSSLNIKAVGTAPTQAEAAAEAATNAIKILDDTKILINAVGYKLKENDLTVHLFLSKIAQELIKEQTIVYINKEVLKSYTAFISGPELPLVAGFDIKTTFPIKEMSVNLQKSNIRIQPATSLNQIKNVYSVIAPPTKSDVFVLYPNDLTNINKLRSKYGIIIDTKIIDILFKYQSSPYLVSLDGSNSLLPVIKNYNYPIVKYVKGQGIDFRGLKTSPYEYILKENINNLDKVIKDYNVKTPIKKVLSNIDNYLYQDVKLLILSNESFGNNLLSQLENSFHLSTYLTLQYLAEHLANVNSNFTLSDLYDLSNVSPYPDLHKNYLEENIGNPQYDVPNDINVLMVRQLIENNEREIKYYNNELDKLKVQIKPDKSNEAKIIGTEYYQNISAKYNEYNTVIIKLNELSPNPINKLTFATKTSKKIIKRYTHDENRGLVMEAWSQLFKNPTPNNYNLVVIDILKKQKELIDKFDPTDLGELLPISKAMEHLSDLGEQYFSAAKFTENNRVLEFIKEKLEYITKLVFGFGIESVMRNILFTHFTDTKPDSTFTEINETIDYILDSETLGLDTSLIHILYNETCPLLVKNSAEIFANNAEEQGHLIQPVREILMGYFQLLENSPYPIAPEIINIFRKDVTNYFDTFIGKSIFLWYVNFENILKYIINNHRCLETLINF